LKLEPNDLANMPSGEVTKPPKPISSVLAVPTWAIISFSGGIFLCFSGRGGLYQQGGIGVRAMLAYTTKETRLSLDLGSNNDRFVPAAVITQDHL
jgi:hypothetical protein